MAAMFEENVTQLCGPEGRHNPGRAVQGGRARPYGCASASPRLASPSGPGWNERSQAAPGTAPSSSPGKCRARVLKSPRRHAGPAARRGAAHGQAPGTVLRIVLSDTRVNLGRVWGVSWWAHFADPLLRLWALMIGRMQLG